MTDIEALRHQAVSAGAAWVTEQGIEASRLDAIIEKRATFTKVEILAGRRDAMGRLIKKDRDEMVTEIDADTRAAIAGGLEDKVEFLLDYAAGTWEPSRFVSRLKEILAG
jgi:hypothetical protein